jgi:hypothetical protein
MEKKVVESWMTMECVGGMYGTSEWLANRQIDRQKGRID